MKFCKGRMGGLIIGGLVGILFIVIISFIEFFESEIYFSTALFFDSVPLLISLPFAYLVGDRLFSIISGAMVIIYYAVIGLIIGWITQLTSKKKKAILISFIIFLFLVHLGITIKVHYQLSHMFDNINWKVIF